MEIHATHFGTSALYNRFGKVLRASIHRNSPNTPLKVHWIEEYDNSITDRLGRGVSGHEIINSLKTKYHYEIVQEARTGTILGMFDLDLLVLHDLSEIEDEKFDIAFTTREQGESTINTGVVFVRVSKKTKEWYKQWYDNVLHLLENNVLRRELKVKYLGINQSGLAMLLQETHELDILELPGLIWNCTPVCFSNFDSEQTKIVHLLNQVKKSIIGSVRSRDPKVNEIVRIWKAMERYSFKLLEGAK